MRIPGTCGASVSGILAAAVLLIGEPRLAAAQSASAGSTGQAPGSSPTSPQTPANPSTPTLIPLTTTTTQTPTPPTLTPMSPCPPSTALSLTTSSLAGTSLGVSSTAGAPSASLRSSGTTAALLGISTRPASVGRSQTGITPNGGLNAGRVLTPMAGSSLGSSTSSLATIGTASTLDACPPRF